MEGDPLSLTFRFAGLGEDSRARVIWIDMMRGSALPVWQAMGSPEYPTAGEIQKLRGAAALPTAEEVFARRRRFGDRCDRREPVRNSSGRTRCTSEPQARVGELHADCDRRRRARRPQGQARGRDEKVRLKRDLGSGREEVFGQTGPPAHGDRHVPEPEGRQRVQFGGEPPRILQGHARLRVSRRFAGPQPGRPGAGNHGQRAPRATRGRSRRCAAERGYAVRW